MAPDQAFIFWALASKTSRGERGKTDMQRAETQQTYMRGYPHDSPEAVGNPPQGEMQPAAVSDGRLEPVKAAVAGPLPGYFVSARYESDCARFISEAKRRARHRAYAQLHPSTLFFKQPSDTRRRERPCRGSSW